MKIGEISEHFLGRNILIDYPYTKAADWEIDSFALSKYSRIIKRLVIVLLSESDAIDYISVKEGEETLVIQWFLSQLPIVPFDSTIERTEFKADLAHDP